MKATSGIFSLHDSVQVIGYETQFHNKLGKIIEITELSGSDAGCGDTITVKLEEINYKLDINIFTTLSIIHYCAVS